LYKNIQLKIVGIFRQLTVDAGAWMVASIILFSRSQGDLTVEGLTSNDPFSIEEISIKASQATGKIKLKDPIKIPTYTGSGGSRESYFVAGGKLKTWSEIQAEIKQLRDDAKFAAAVLIETARSELLTQLSKPVDLSTGSAFLGVGSLPFSAITTFEASVSLDLAFACVLRTTTSCTGWQITSSWAGSGSRRAFVSSPPSTLLDRLSPTGSLEPSGAWSLRHF
jgi:hypothetical protein